MSRISTAEQSKWLAIRQGMVKRSNNQEAFFGELDETPAGLEFSTIAGFLGKSFVLT
jgi:hypothetical protein